MRVCQIYSLKDNQIFVFDSNLSGIYGAGAAKKALDFGAERYVGVGRTGQCYAIPTKDWKIRTLRLEDIRPYVMKFIQYAKEHPELEFLMTRIGCGLAGYKDEDIAPMFYGCPANVIMPPEWVAFFSRNN